MKIKLNDVKLVKGFSGMGVRFTLTKVWDGQDQTEFTEAIRGCTAWRQKNGSIRVLPPTTYTTKLRSKPFKATLWSPSLMQLLAQAIEKSFGHEMTRVERDPEIPDATETEVLA